MQTVTFSCDQCKAKVADRNELIGVKLGYGGYQYSRIEKTFDLCPKCAEKLGFIKRVIKDEKIVNEFQDLKDRLYEVIAEVVRNNYQEMQIN